MPTFAINFSRPGAQIVAQYYAFMRFGFDGFKRIQDACRSVAAQIAAGFERVGPFEALTRGDDLPVVAVKLKPETTVYNISTSHTSCVLVACSARLYTFPENLEDLAVLRVVVRNGMTADLANILIDDIERVVGDLEQFGGRKPEAQHGSGFHH